MINRRGFITSFAAALAYDPERALYTPGKVTHSVPSGKVFLPAPRTVLFVNGAAQGAPVFWQEVGGVVDVRFKLGKGEDAAAPLSMVIPAGNARSLSQIFDELAGEAMTWGPLQSDPSTIVFRDRKQFDYNNRSKA